jgi:DNA polymerase-1
MTGIATVLRHRDVARSLEFLLGFQDLLVAHEDGTSRLHPDLKRGTITGRLACRDPNLQQVPSYEGDLYKTREIFVPPPGHKLIVADYSALEYFIAAHIHIKLFGDRKLADNLATIHEQVAAFVFRDRPYMKGVRPEDIKNHPDGRVRKTRKDSKAIGYGTSYGAGPSNLGSKITDNRGIAIGPKAGEKLQNEYFEFLPAVKRFQDWVTERVLAGKPVPTLGGRMLHYPANNRGVRQGLNAPLQGSGADIMDSAMIRFTRRVRELGLGAKLILNVHDELVATAPESQAEETREVMQWAMCGAWDLEIPLEAEAKIGDSWAEAK